MDAYVQLLGWRGIVGILSGVLAMASVVPYVFDIVKGETRPSAVTFGLWTVLNGMAAAAQFDAGASFSVIVIIVVTLNCTIVTGLALSGYGQKGDRWVNVVSFALVIAAAIGWKTAGPAVAIACAVAADLFASVPTIHKVFHEPRSENLSGWGMIATAGALGAISADRADVENLAMQINVALSSGLIFALAYFGRSKAR
jgi:hypothetical protein